MVWRNHRSGALPEDNCPDHLNKNFASSEKSQKAFFHLLIYIVMMMMVVKIVVMIVLIMMTSMLIIHLSDMFLWPLAQKNALGPSSSLGSKLQNLFQS